MKDKSDGGSPSSHDQVMELVENDKVFSDFVDHKFKELDTDGDGKLSVAELQPAVNDIGAALGFPAQGTSPQSDHIYTEVFHELTHGKQEQLNKTEFKEVLTDFLIGMAAGLKQDPVVILRIDGEDLHEFITSPNFLPEILSIFSGLEFPDAAPLKDCIIKAFEKLTVDHGMPPATDPWVMCNILEPALESINGAGLQQPISQETFLEEFRKTADAVVQLLKEQPAIVAHTHSTFDGSSVRRLLSNKFEHLDEILDSAIRAAPRDSNGKISREYLAVALESLASCAGLPPRGAVYQVDNISSEALKTVDGGDGRSVKDEELKKLLTQVLGSIMMQLEGNPVSVSVINSVVHEECSFP